MKGAIILSTMSICSFPRKLINKNYTPGSFALGFSFDFCLWGVLAGGWREGVECSQGIFLSWCPHEGWRSHFPSPSCPLSFWGPIAVPSASPPPCPGCGNSRAAPDLGLLHILLVSLHSAHTFENSTSVSKISLNNLNLSMPSVSHGELD